MERFVKECDWTGLRKLAQLFHFHANICNWKEKHSTNINITNIKIKNRKTTKQKFPNQLNFSMIEGKNSKYKTMNKLHIDFDMNLQHSTSDICVCFWNVLYWLLYMLVNYTLNERHTQRIRHVTSINSLMAQRNGPCSIRTVAASASVHIFQCRQCNAIMRHQSIWLVTTVIRISVATAIVCSVTCLFWSTPKAGHCMQHKCHFTQFRKAV